ncbi:MAG: hypothetical protein LBP60_01990 [Spirochaetaceae bacterium]|nr:hypothetical protein [Spirochaetaceae bacterium]
MRGFERKEFVRANPSGGSAVREYAAYDRLEGLEEQALLTAVYDEPQNVNKVILRLRQRLAQVNRIQTQEQA